MPDIFNPTPSYIFRMRVDTLFINKSETRVNREGNAGLEFYLKCESYNLDNLKCHIQKTISYLPSPDSIHQVENNFFTLSSLQFTGIRFRMEFDVKGVKSYHFLAENVENKETLLTIYQTIGDQLSVGTDLRTKDFEFTAIENSVIGKCPADYDITTVKSMNNNEIELVSFLASEGYELNEHETFFIKKVRRVNECYPKNNYILGKILWDDLITSNDIVRLSNSRTEMLFGLGEFTSVTLNTFMLHNATNGNAGVVLETIRLTLDSIN
ncbi:uncharacterized protein LOC116845097 isoform X2 [Odontomachus brunneus]|nr:uncharacterized protein LOC116845097 isoform X2 [Odontomachus brunneus]